MSNLVPPQWHLKARMSLCGIGTIAALRDALAAKGISLSKVQVGRMVRHLPQRVDTLHLAALCDILHCSIGDLMSVAVAPAPAKETAPAPLSTVPSETPRPPRLQTLSPEERELSTNVLSQRKP